MNLKRIVILPNVVFSSWLYEGKGREKTHKSLVFHQNFRPTQSGLELGGMLFFLLSFVSLHMVRYIL